MNKRCKICDNKTTELGNNVMRVRYYYCDECHFISKDRHVRLDTAEELAIYDSHQNSIEDPRYVDYFRSFIKKAILPYCKDGGEGLDFGSGPEPVLATLLERDHSFSMEIYDLYYTTDKSYKKKKYDFITTTEVLEHLDDPLEYFSLFYELLHNGGILAIMTNFHSNDEDHFNQWHYTRDRSHISFYTSETLETIAEMTGFRSIYHDGHKNIVLQKKENRNQ